MTFQADFHKIILMMDKKSLALSYFSNHYNCSQSVLAAYAQDFGLSEEIALKISCGFGAGMGRLQETCGAISGAFMVLGLKYGKSKDHEENLKELTYEKVREFSKIFKLKYESLKCIDLIGVDISKKDGLELARNNHLFDKLCTQYISEVIDILEGIL